MNLIAILIALGLEQWRAFRWRGGVQKLFGRYARFLERRFNAGTEQQGALTALLALGPPVAIAAAGLRSPEFEITTETTVVSTVNFIRNAIYTYVGPNSDRITLNLSNEISLASNPANLIDHLNSLLLAGTMSNEMRNILVNAVGQIPARCGGCPIAARNCVAPT